jgi:uncharacterized protein YdaU (DUF1376 family)
MLDIYYDTEAPLPLDVVKLSRKLIAISTEESTAVEQVLNEFFKKTDAGWYNGRCEEVIFEYHKNISAKSAAGKASAAKREEIRLLELNKKATAVEQVLNDRGTGAQLTSNQEPVTSNQEEKKKDLSSKPDDSVMEVFQHWQKVMGTEKAKASPERISKIKARLKDYTVAQLKKAVDGCSKSKHHMGQNDRKTKYNDIELICRDCKHVDSFLQEPTEEENSLITGRGWAN